MRRMYSEKQVETISTKLANESVVLAAIEGSNAVIKNYLNEQLKLAEEQGYHWKWLTDENWEETLEEKDGDGDINYENHVILGYTNWYLQKDTVDEDYPIKLLNESFAIGETKDSAAYISLDSEILLPETISDLDDLKEYIENGGTLVVDSGLVDELNISFVTSNGTLIAYPTDISFTNPASTGLEKGFLQNVQITTLVIED